MPDTNVRAILLDIEGTTTPIEFVYKVLFPFARRHVREFIKQHNESDEDLRAIISGLSVEHSLENPGHIQSGRQAPPWDDNTPDSQLDSVTQYVYWLMDQDRKSTALKSLQGKIWEAGYANGRLLSEVYPDVPTSFARWRKQEQKIYIYSSGSILAQKLLFAHTNYGDLSGYIDNYLDTTTGAKKSWSSYQTIAEKIGLPTGEVLFLSDVTSELDAALDAGMRTTLCVRPWNAEVKSTTHPTVHTFNVVFP